MEHDEISKFYDKLDEELYTFKLDKHALIETYDFIIFEYVDGQIAGLGGVRNKHEIYLAVRTPYQGNKIGQKILERIIIKAKSENLNFLILTVFITNRIAIHIYKKFKFIKIYSINVDGKKSNFMFLPLNMNGYFLFFFYLVKIFILKMFLRVKNITNIF
ncbi:MAG: GNAT family N-acetyltransferase [Methanobacterium formicicum]